MENSQIMHVKKPIKCILIIVAVILSIACCMLPVGYDGSIQQQSQEGFIFYDNGVEDLILKVSPKISGKKSLNKFCWLITVPNEPNNYKVIEADLFKQLYKLKNTYLVRPKSTSNLFSTNGIPKSESIVLADSSVELGRHVEVGAYDIQPVRGVGKNALSGLNSWLTKKGFPTESDEHMKYFVDKKFTFLCIKVNPDSQTKKMGQSPQLKPLRMTFKSDKIYYPMKYSSQQGNFSVNLYTITTMPIDYKLSSKVLKRINWIDQRLFKNVNLVDKIKSKDLNEVLGEKKHSHIYFNSFYCKSPNKDNAISKWKEDVFLSLNASHSPNGANRIEGRRVPFYVWILCLLVVLLLFSAIKFRLKRKK